MLNTNIHDNSTSFSDLIFQTLNMRMINAAAINFVPNAIFAPAPLLHSFNANNAASQRSINIGVNASENSVNTIAIGQDRITFSPNR